MTVPFVDKRNMGCMKKSGRSGKVTVRGLSIYTFPLNLMASKSADAQEFLIIDIYRMCERAHIVRLYMSYISRAMNNGCGQAILQIAKIVNFTQSYLGLCLEN